MSAFDNQVDGDHYTKLAIQPFAYSMANRLDPLQHTVVKYVTRFRDKGGVKDLRKAIHTLELLIEYEEGQTLTPGCAATGMTAEDAAELRRMQTQGMTATEFETRIAAHLLLRKIVDYPVVFSAPQGWGKTARGAELAKEFGCVGSMNDPELAALQPGWLYFTNIVPPKMNGCIVGLWYSQPCRIVSRGWKMQDDFDTGPPVKP